jgi:translation elongation factor EF-1beta
MSDTLEVLIDLSQADLDLEPEDLETYTRQLAKELKDGLAEDASLMRFTETPEGRL